MTEDKKPGLLRAFAEPAPLLLAILGLVMAGVIHNPEGLVLGAVFLFLSYIAANVVRKSPAFRSKIQHAQNTRESSEEKWKRTHIIERLDSESRVQLKIIVNCFDEIKEEIGSLGIEGLSSEFSSISLQTDILVNRSMEIAQKRSQLISFLIKADPDNIRQRITETEKKISNEAIASGDIQATLDMQKEELTNIVNAENVCANILGHLQMISATMTNLRSQFLSLKTKDAQAALEVKQGYSRQIDKMSESIDQLEADTTNIPNLTE